MEHGEQVVRLYGYCHRLWPKFNLESRQAENTIRFDLQVIETFRTLALETTYVFTLEELQFYWQEINGGFTLVERQFRQMLETITIIRDEMQEVNLTWQRHLRDRGNPNFIILWRNAASLVQNCNLVNAIVRRLYHIWRELAVVVAARTAPLIETAELFAGLPIVDEHFRKNYPYYTTQQIDVEDIVLGPGPVPRQ